MLRNNKENNENLKYYASHGITILVSSIYCTNWQNNVVSVQLRAVLRNLVSAHLSNF